MRRSTDSPFTLSLTTGCIAAALVRLVAVIQLTQRKMSHKRIPGVLLELNNKQSRLDAHAIARLFQVGCAESSEILNADDDAVLLQVAALDGVWAQTCMEVGARVRAEDVLAIKRQRRVSNGERAARNPLASLGQVLGTEVVRL